MRAFLEARLEGRFKILFYESLLDLYPEILSEQPLVTFVDGKCVSENELGVFAVLRRTFPHMKILLSFPQESRSLAARSISQGADAYILEPFYTEELEQFVLQAFRNAEHEIDHSVALRMEALALFIQVLSAEVNNRLTPILASLQMLMGENKDFMNEEDLQESYGRMYEEALKIARTVDELENFAKPRKPKKNVCSLKATIDRAIAEAQQDSRNKVPVEHQYAGVRKKVLIDQEQIVRALTAVIRILKENADEKEGKIVVKSSMPGDERIEVDVEGFKTIALGEEAHQAFIPLYLRNVIRFGHEIGLAAAFGLIKAHEGSIKIETLALGTRFLISIPQEEA
ncbi:MAG: hypothetical protein ACYTG7_10910 [Planctomycetota bacterium]